MEKFPTSVVTLDPDTAARIAKRSAETGLTPEQLIASLVRHDDEGDEVDPSVIEDLEARWAEYEAGGETVPHEEVRDWLKTWGTPDFKAWSKSR